MRATQVTQKVKREKITRETKLKNPQEENGQVKILHKNDIKQNNRISSA